MKKLLRSPAGKIATLVVALAMTLLAAQAARASAPTRSTAAPAAVVAHNQAGKLTSRIAGTTADGRRVTGSFTPLEFSQRDGTLVVKGLVKGLVHGRNGGSSTFAQLRTVEVKSVNGATQREGAAAGRARCDILNLVLAPLDLDLLGLQVHLDRVVLNIVAVSGAGNLLGNLLCAVAGLLDGGLGGVLGRLVDLLNQILGVLRLG